MLSWEVDSSIFLPSETLMWSQAKLWCWANWNHGEYDYVTI